MMNKNDKLFQKFADMQHRQATVGGLMIAQVIAQRHFMEAFDGIDGGTIVANIMGDIAEAMAVLNGELSDEEAPEGFLEAA